MKPALCFYLLGFCGLIALASVRAGAAPEDLFRIAGAVAQPRTWSVAQVKREVPASVRTVTYTLKGKRHTARVVSLWALLMAAQPHLNPHIKHHLLQFVAAVQGQDGYTADFTFGELSLDFGHRAVWVALDEDGKPFTGDSGPVQILVPEDKKPARWVHAVRAITVVDEVQTPAPAGT